MVTNCRGNIQTVLIQYLIYKIGIDNPSSNANSYYSLLILRKLRAESVHNSNIAHWYIPGPSGHANIGIIFFCIGNPQWCSYNNQPILIGCLTLSQEYCKLIGLYWKLMRRQLWTLTYFIGFVSQNYYGKYANHILIIKLVNGIPRSIDSKHSHFTTFICLPGCICRLCPHKDVYSFLHFFSIRWGWVVYKTFFYILSSAITINKL